MISVEVRNSFDGLEQEYAEFAAGCTTPVFYDQRFLRAAEHAPLLPVQRTYYLLLRDAGRLVGFMPAYLQGRVDPFGVLARTTGLSFGEDAPGLFTHIMHGYESTFLLRRRELQRVALQAFAELARDVGAPYYGILNVIDEALMDHARHLDLRVNYMWDRFRVDLARIPSFDAFVEQKLPRDGRQELKRQLRKFEQSNARATIEELPVARLSEIAELIQATTKKNGTPEYYPVEQMIRFISECAGLVRVISIQTPRQRVGTLVCFLKDSTLHLWAGGMAYDYTDFSPYTVCFATAFRFAIEQKLACVEAGRTNARIKQRLGFSPRPLYSILGATTGSKQSGRLDA